MKIEKLEAIRRNESGNPTVIPLTNAEKKINEIISYLNEQAEQSEQTHQFTLALAKDCVALEKRFEKAVAGGQAQAPSDEHALFKYNCPQCDCDLSGARETIYRTTLSSLRSEIEKMKKEPVEGDYCGCDGECFANCNDSWNSALNKCLELIDKR